MNHRGLASLVFALAACASLGGCGDDRPATETPLPPHEHHAPHGGALEVIGDEAAHVELVLDPATGTLTGYVLDGEAEKPVRIAQDVLRIKIADLPGGETTVELRPVASVLTGEKVGDTSQFEGASERLKGVAKFEGVLESITARGVKFDAVPIGWPGGNERKEK